jgi:hypothetical protein
MKALSIVYISVLLISLSACKGQTNNMIAPKKENSGIAIHDTLNKPKFNVKVNKEFDSKGNLIRYDSTYSYSFKGNGSMAFPDSLGAFKFSRSPWAELFNVHKKMLSADSLFKQDFFKNDFFRQQEEWNQLFFDSFGPKTDSLLKRQLSPSYFRPGSKTI